MRNTDASKATDPRESVLHHVYRQEVPPQQPVTNRDPKADFLLFRTPFMSPTHVKEIVRQFGATGGMKALAKLATPKRDLFAYFVDGRIASFGWIMHGDCRHYRIESDASVIGPIYTNEEYRGKGYVVDAMRLAMSRLANAGHRLFYIDVNPSNAASEKAIRKAGFSGPVAVIAIPEPPNP